MLVGRGLTEPSSCAPQKFDLALKRLQFPEWRDQHRPSAPKRLLRRVESDSYEIDYIERIQLQMIARQLINDQ